MQANLEKICSHFKFKGNFKEIMPYGDGHINDTYKVTYTNDFEEETNYILQRINHLIFTQTHNLMMNIEGVTSYLTDIIKDADLVDYDVLTLIWTYEDECYLKTDQGLYFRAYAFVEDAIGHTFTDNTDLLYEAGKTFGEFQKLLSDFPVEKLKETIVGFHHTPSRYKGFIDVMKLNKLQLNKSCLKEIEFVKNRSEMMSLITDGLDQGTIPYRVTHNDTKLNNVLIDTHSNKGRCVIDLDTVMPGSALYDFGDAIRSCASSVAEDEENLDLLTLDFERFEAYTKGFLEILKDQLTAREIQLLAEAAVVMTLECGMRFLTDHLQGDVYFKTHKKDHNLIRARNQFRFVEVMEEHLDSLKSIVSKYS